MTLVALSGGLTVPERVIALAVRLEMAGYVLVHSEGVLRLQRQEGETPTPLDDATTTEIRSSKSHLLALVDYKAQP
jgi:hypothetical protein